MTDSLATTLQSLEQDRQSGTRRLRAQRNLEAAGGHQARALRRQGLALARVPYVAMLDAVTEAGEGLPENPECPTCAPYAKALKRFTKLQVAHQAMAELSKAVQQTSLAVSNTMRLQELLKGMPDSRAESKHVSIQAWMALLTDEQFRMFEGWVKQAQGRALGA